MNETELMHNEPDDALDVILRSEMRWQAPPDLTERLQQIARSSSLAARSQPAPVPVRAQAEPVTWYSVLVMVLTAAAVSLSFGVAWEFYDIIEAQLGINALWGQVDQTIALWMQWLYTELPAARQVVPVLGTLYEQLSWLLNWLLIAAVLWLALDEYIPSSKLQQQHQTS
jgi:hypothetical protein